MYRIAKTFNMSYGHRVHSQQLNKNYSIDSHCACKHLHGHNADIIVHLEAVKLIDGMITDFKHLNWFKQFIDNVLDHKFIIDINDPIYNIIIVQPPQCTWTKPPATNVKKWELMLTSPELYYTINKQQYENAIPEIRDLLDGFVIVDFVPTSENLSRWLHGIVQEKMNKIGVICSSVQFFETPKSQSHYIQ